MADHFSTQGGRKKKVIIVIIIIIQRENTYTRFAERTLRTIGAIKLSGGGRVVTKTGALVLSRSNVFFVGDSKESSRVFIRQTCMLSLVPAKILTTNRTGEFTSSVAFQASGGRLLYLKRVYSGCKFVSGRQVIRLCI